MGALVSVSKETSKLNVDVGMINALKQRNKLQKAVFLLLCIIGHFKARAQFVACNYLTPCHAMKVPCSNLMSFMH